MAEPLLADTPPLPRYCAGCSHVHGGRAFGLCLVKGCFCITVQAAPPDLSPDPWLVSHWRHCDHATCDGCGKPDCPVMRVDGGGHRHV